MAPRVKKPLRKRPRKNAKKPTVSLAIKKYVKSTISKNIENKCVQVNFGQSFGNILEAPNMNMYPMLPYLGYMSIPQGVTQGTRVGNQIKVKKLMLNYVLRPTNYDAVFNPQTIPSHIDMFLGYVNDVPGLIPTNTDLTSLFQSGASSIGPAGTLRDLISVVNTDYWTIKKRWQHKLGFATNNGTGGSATGQYYATNDFKFNIIKKMDITKLVHKNLKFNDGTATIQGNNLYFFYQAIAANGAAYAANSLPCNIEFWIDIHYEDA